MSTLPATIQERVSLPESFGGSGGEGGGPPTASDLFSMIRRRMVLITALFVLFGAMTGGGFAAWWLYFPGYRAASLVECISNIPDSELSLEQQQLRREDHEAFVMSQAVLVKSTGILAQALEVTAVKETQWYQSQDPNRRLLELTNDLGAAPVRGTNFMRVAMECRNRTDAAIIVNEVVNRWYHTVRKRSAEEFTDARLEAGLEEQQALRRSISEDRTRLKELAQRLPAGALHNPGGNVTVREVEQFSFQVGIAKLELSQLEHFRSIYNDPGGVAVTAEDRALVEQDPQVFELSNYLFRLEQQLAADSNVYGSGHEILRQLHAQVEAADEKLAQLRAEKLQERRADMREAANTAYANSQYALLAAEDNLARAEATLQDQDQQKLDYDYLMAEVEQQNERLVLLNAYVQSMTRVRDQRSAIRVSVAQAATDPIERSSPSLLLIPIGVFLSLALSMALALGLEMLDTSVRTTQDLTRHVEVAVLGAIPDTDDEEVPIDRIETAVSSAPESMVAEAFRRVRTNLQFAAPIEQQRTLMVTSPRPSDGKTTVACNLAIAGALAGRRVLLVDANFRRPTVHQVFSGTTAKGLSNLLTGQGILGECVSKTDIPTLEVVGSGPTPPNPVELLGSDRCRAFLDEAMTAYDQVIIDTAPVLLASESLVLSTLVNGTIVVIRANENTRGIARRAFGLLSDVGAPVFGAVLNAAQARRGGYFREQLREYYDYQPDASQKSARSLPSDKTT